MRSPEFERAFANLRDTYLNIGNAGPDVEILREKHFVACRNKHKHPTCNFAVFEQPNLDVLRQAAEFGRNSKTFYGYSPGSEDDEPDEKAFGSAGFRHATLLYSLFGGEPIEESTVEWQAPENESERLELARFMARQFFAVQPLDVQDVVARSTCGSGLTLMAAIENGQRVGAVMLNEIEATLGIYNFCVESGLRDRGIGTRMLNSLLFDAQKKGVVAALQCDRKLISWYERFGMNVHGVVDIWCLDD